MHLAGIFANNGADSHGVKSILRESEADRQFNLSLNREHIIPPDQIEPKVTSTKAILGETSLIESKKESGTTMSEYSPERIKTSERS